LLTHCRAIRAGVAVLPERRIDARVVRHLPLARGETGEDCPRARALTWLPTDSRVRLIHIGEALSDDYARAASELMAQRWPTVERYRWLGRRGHAETRRRIRDAQAMVISSTMERGANVVVEAVTCGVPVIASRIAGNVGMLGADYDGCFPAGDDQALAHLLNRIERDRDFLTHLRGQCAARAPLFEPARERDAVNGLVDDTLDWAASRPHDDALGNEAKAIGNQRERQEAR